MSGEMANFNEQHLEISKMFEKDGRLELAIKQLENCVNDKLYEKVLEKKGDLLLRLAKYKDASVVFKECGEKYIIKSSTTGSIYAKPLFFMSMLSIMATKKIVDSNKHLDELINLDQSFVNSCEGKCVTDIIKSLNSGNVNDFEQACATYELFRKLTSLQIDLLILAKEMLVGVAVDLTSSDDGIDLC